jgi:hypothetical protein
MLAYWGRAGNKLGLVANEMEKVSFSSIFLFFSLKTVNLSESSF